MKWYRRFETWLIVMAVVASLVISCSGCTRTEPAAQPGKPPAPSHVVARYHIPQSNSDRWSYPVIEFRASNGNICVLVETAYAGVMDCSPPLPPLNYEDLPPAEGEDK